MSYTEFKEKQEKQFGAFPMFFAFSDKQFDEGLKKFNAKPGDLCRIFGGGFILKKDKEAFSELNKKLAKDKKEFLDNEDNLINAIEYELGNHEFCITYDASDTISALGLDLDNEKTVNCFNKAKKKYMDWCYANDVF